MLGHVVQPDPIIHREDSICTLILGRAGDSFIAAVLGTGGGIRAVSGVPVASVVAGVIVGNIVEPSILGSDSDCACNLGWCTQCRVSQHGNQV